MIKKIVMLNNEDFKQIRDVVKQENARRFFEILSQLNRKQNETKN